MSHGLGFDETNKYSLQEGDTYVLKTINNLLFDGLHQSTAETFQKLTDSKRYSPRSQDKTLEICNIEAEFELERDSE